VPNIKATLADQKPGLDKDRFNMAIERMRRNMDYNIDKQGLTIDTDLVLATTDKERKEDIDFLVKKPAMGPINRNITARLQTSVMSNNRYSNQQ
jgi:hypothetical protein